MSRNSNYWQDRIRKQSDILWEKSLGQLDKELLRQYKRALNETIRDMSELWDKLLADSEDGKVKPNDLYRMNRYYQIRNNLEKRLRDLGLKEKEIYGTNLTGNYKHAQETIQSLLDELLGKGGSQYTSFTMEQENAAKHVIDSVWCSDGKHWSDRIWNNKTKLEDKIIKGLVDCVSRGVSKDELVKTIMNDFGNGFYEADRIARTELTYVQNQACKDRYEKAGITEYKYLAEIDGRTSPICRELNGKVFSFTHCVVGENMPPMHPNCRSTIVPVIK